MTEFDILARKVFAGPGGAAALARAVHVNRRSAERWLKGDAPVPPGVVDWLRGQVAIVEQLGLEKRAIACGYALIHDGLHPEVAGGVLRSAARRVGAIEAT